MRHCDRSQTDQGEVLDDCCYVTSTLGTFCSEDHIIIKEKISLLIKEGINDIHLSFL